jgi:hypothetical protein
VKAGATAGILDCVPLPAKRFIPYSPNKVGGTREHPEHRSFSFVVGAGNAST